MNMAVESVKTGAMSINQAALSYNMPYSSLYGRISKLKRENPVEWQVECDQIISLSSLDSVEFV